MKKIENFSVVILKIFTILVGLFVLILCIFVLPQGIISELTGDFDYGFLVVGIYLSMIPVGYFLCNSFIFLNHLGPNKLIADSWINVLRKIKYSALSISIIYTLAMPYIFFLGNKDDAPGVVALGLFIIVIFFVFANLADIIIQIINKLFRKQ